LTFTEKYIFEPIPVGDVHFRNPFCVASGSITKNVKQLISAEQTGWSGASIKLTIAPEPYINREPRYGYFAEHKKFAFTTEKRLSPQEGLKLAEEARKKTSELVRLGNIIALKRGDKGSLVIKGESQTEMPAYLNENVVNAIGAGDSINAGFLFKYVNGGSLDECQKFANLTGAISTTQAGGTSAFESYDQVMKIAETRFGY